MASAILSLPASVLTALTNLALCPLVSGPLLLSTTYFPSTVRQAVDALARAIPSPAIASWLNSFRLDSPTLLTTLRVLLGLGLARTANRLLSTAASNNWRLTAAPGWDDWKQEIAVVTGGSSGIGKAMVQRLLRLGVRVAILDVQEPPKELASHQGVFFVHCDVTSSESVKAAADAVRAHFGGRQPSILINNAGVARPMPILQTQEPFLRRILGVNLMSMWFTTQQFLPAMVAANKGHVITIASVASFIGLATAADYSATKAGALAFHESLTVELRHHYHARRVLTTVVHPNFVQTPLVDSFAERLRENNVKLLTPEQIAEEVVAQIESKRGGQLVIPGRSAFISAVRGWPTWMQELGRDIVGRASVGRVQ